MSISSCYYLINKLLMHCSGVHLWKRLWRITVLRILSFCCVSKLEHFKIKFNIRVVQLLFTIRQLNITIGNKILWCLTDLVCDWITRENVMFYKIWFVYLMFWYLSWCAPDSILVCMWHILNREINFYYALCSFAICLLSVFWNISGQFLQTLQIA